MQIIVSKYSGYCYGVKRAVSMAQESIEKYDDIYSLGSIIHNKKAVEKLTDNGLKIVQDIDKEQENIIFRSHGVEKKFYKFARENNINIIDTTCTFVKKIHQIVEEQYKKGYKIIIVGSKIHPEVIGINSYADYQAQFVEEEKDISNLVISNDDKYSIVFQTTFNIEKYDSIVNKLKEKIKNIDVHNTICNATKKRQDAALELAKNVDMMIVIGDKSSSNSKKLYDIASSKKKSIFIEDVNQLDIDMFKNIKKAGITAGASTPDFVIDEVIEFLNKI
ncbi:MAG: 4-hydroxy-3-methylbut-2-enyl diphosphate reductase [Peptostreptococcaceae bacterium]|nr:4-hydroxy-3-methylbut-2-enyl diphosphate reductase [Peptostreptococcaceae bacterium]